MNLLPVGARLGLAVAAAVISTSCRPAPGGWTVPGTVEVYQSDAAPLVGGRIEAVRVEEGDTVRVGDTLAVLIRSTLDAAVSERQARLAVARARLADLQRGSRSAELERARADLATAEAEAGRSARELERTGKLAAEGVVSPQELDRAATAAETARRRRDAARATLDLLGEGSREDQIRAAMAEVRSAEAQLLGARVDVGELVVQAQVDGVVLGRHAEPGEVVAAGTPVITIGEVARPWVRIYLPAAQLATLPAGTEVEVVPAGTARGTAGVRGRLKAVSPEAEFTPRIALTEEERADLLFAARVELLSPPPAMRPGLPVAVRFPPAGNP